MAGKNENSRVIAARVHRDVLEEIERLSSPMESTARFITIAVTREISRRQLRLTSKEKPAASLKNSPQASGCIEKVGASETLLK